jgi:hypothetical protein
MASSNQPRQGETGAAPTASGADRPGGTRADAPLHKLKEGLSAYAKEKASAARDEASSLIEQQKAAAGASLVDLSDALHEASELLRNRSQTVIAGLAQSAADQVESVATAIRERDLGELIEDTQQIARRNPELFFAGAILLGFLFSRIIRSSAENGEVEATETVYRDSSYASPPYAMPGDA